MLETPAQGVSLGRWICLGRKDCAPKPSTTPGPAAHTIHTVLMVLVEVLIGVPAHSELCGVVVNSDRGVIPWGVACGRPRW